jgi:DNA sulfur modification protein DndB
MTDTGYSHTFPAIRGVQAGRVFYVAMCPMKIIPKIFIFNEEEVPPELRAQRILNRARIPEISSYLLENPNNYILSALTASVDSKDITFQSYAEKGPASNMGTLNVPMDVNILINDGQHRRAAIEEAIKENAALSLDNIPVLFFMDAGLARSQQMFADLNKYAVRPSYSLGTLYDQRDPSSELARYLANTCIAFSGITELEKSTISNRSTKLFTLSGIKHASRALLRKTNTDKISEADKDIAREFWDTVSEHFPDWKRAKERTVATAELRQNYIHAHGVAIHALGIVGADILSSRPKDWKKSLQKLSKIDWSRSNTRLWEGRAMVHGRISKTNINVLLTANLIKNFLGLPLKPEEAELEIKFTHETKN